MKVKIFKGSKEKLVPKSSFDNFYKNSGWSLGEAVETSKEEIKEEPIQEEVDETTDDEWDEAIDEEVEKPLSEMNNTELIQYAADNNIDITGLKGNKQIREAIKAAM